MPKSAFFSLKRAFLRLFPLGVQKCVFAAIPVGCAKSAFMGLKAYKTGPDTGYKGQKGSFYCTVPVFDLLPVSGLFYI